ncbi:MAG TPA: NUDIX pyrophosphatase [Balneolales bacterium]|nr:NUDIX pyrophosphatase [Balneolales bacterium]
MPDLKVIDVYPYHVFEGNIEYLLLHRSTDKLYAGQWRMVGGKVQAGETSWQAGLRELREETGAIPQKYWSVPSINHFYDYKSDQILYIPAFAALLDIETPVLLNSEHDDYKWLTMDEASKLIQWPEQIRLITIINKIVLQGEVLSNWIIE